MCIKEVCLNVPVLDQDSLHPISAGRLEAQFHGEALMHENISESSKVALLFS